MLISDQFLILTENLHNGTRSLTVHGHLRYTAKKHNRKCYIRPVPLCYKSSLRYIHRRCFRCCLLQLKFQDRQSAADNALRSRTILPGCPQRRTQYYYARMTSSRAPRRSVGCLHWIREVLSPNCLQVLKLTAVSAASSLSVSAGIVKDVAHLGDVLHSL